MATQRLIRHLVLLGLMMAACFDVSAQSWWMAVNVKQSPQAPWGSEAALISMKRLASSGADSALLVAFVWQENTDSNDPILGKGNSLDEIRTGLRQIRRAGLRPILKIHLWIPGYWAGDARPTAPNAWFDRYRDVVLSLAKVTAEEQAEALILGTELRGLEDAPQWPALIRDVRMIYKGKLSYVADSLERAVRFTYWSQLDAIGTSLYPSLPVVREQRLLTMRETAEKLALLGKHHARPVWVLETGMRSSDSSLSAPWESPEERRGRVDLDIQREVLVDWKNALRAAGLQAMGIWCWYTDPAEGGETNTDFTVQNKPAQTVFN